MKKKKKILELNKAVANRSIWITNDQISALREETEVYHLTEIMRVKASIICAWIFQCIVKDII